DDVVRLVEVRLVVAGLAWRAKTEQQLSTGAELVHLLTLGAILVGGKVRYPDVALIVHMDAVRSHHHAGAEVGEHFAGVTVELEDGIYQVGIAGDRRACPETAGATALVGPDVAIVGVKVDTRGRSP